MSGTAAEYFQKCSGPELKIPESLTSEPGNMPLFLADSEDGG
jgi:hypothetical protein